MQDAEFWQLIELVDVSALRDGDEEAAVSPLLKALSQGSVAQQEGFEEQLAQKLFALDGRIYADAAGRSGQSGDGFLYARCFVVALGRKHYEAVLADPKQMPTSSDDWCEALLSVAREAFEDSGGKKWSFEASVSYETGSNSALW